VFKRVIDITCSAAALVVLAPLLAITALVIRRSSPGPVLYRQTRVGRDGHEFEILKFRSMAVGVEEWDGAKSPRITPFGRLIRATAIDELPQLWNILRGDMSLVGPRPERPNYAAMFDDSVPTYSRRLRAPVGLTGLSQVSGLRGDTSIESRARMDNLYVDRWSARSDVSIMLRTLTAALQRQPRD
jgi:lipopolysaccharide/colanic/teichoic acid biosynthesis glycosyltransferase